MTDILGVLSIDAHWHSRNVPVHLPSVLLSLSFILAVSTDITFEEGQCHYTRVTTATHRIVVAFVTVPCFLVLMVRSLAVLVSVSGSLAAS